MLLLCLSSDTCSRGQAASPTFRVLLTLSLLKTALDHPGGAGSTAVAAALIDAACLVNAEGAAADIAFAVGSSWAWEDETVAAP